MSGTPYTSSLAQVLRGSQFSIGSATGQSDTYVLIGETIMGSFSGSKADILDTTNMQSGVYREKLPSQIDAGQLKLTYNRVSNNAGQMAVEAAFAALVPYDFQVVLPLNKKAGQVTTGDTITFSGIITGGPEFDIEVAKVAQCSVTIDITGPLSRVEGA